MVKAKIRLSYLSVEQAGAKRALERLRELTLREATGAQRTAQTNCSRVRTNVKPLHLTIMGEAGKIKTVCESRIIRGTRPELLANTKARETKRAESLIHFSREQD